MIKNFIFFKLIYIFILFFCLYCNKFNSYETFQPGTYNGIYSITHDYNSVFSFTESGPATFTFTDTSYHCHGEEYLLPPGGGGEYEIMGNVMVLHDMVDHTAEFDWTLILDGEFNYSLDGNNLILEQVDAIHKRLHLIYLVKED
jgi:hypothetical protein